MASTVFQPTLTTIVAAMTIAIATIAKCADDITFNAVTTSQLEKEKFIVKTTVTPSQKAANPKYRVVARNGTAIKSLYDETETATSELSTRAAYCTMKEDADVELGALLDASESAMVTLIAGDTRLTAHRAVLAARSPGFARLFCHGMQDASRSEVALPDVEGPVLRQLVAYLYTLQAPQLPSMAPQLLAAADKFGLSSLKAECDVQVASQLSVETAAATAVLAIRHSSTTLRQAAIAFIKAHLVQVIATRGWANTARYHPEEMAEVYRLLTELPLEASTPATAESQLTTAPPSLPRSSQGWTLVTAAPVSQPTTKAPSLPHTRHAQTPVAAASSSPITSAADDAVSRFRKLSVEERGRRLITAAKEGAVWDVEALLAAGADVKARDESMETALHYAAYWGHVEVARCLLGAGPEVDARDDLQTTPLHFAAYKSHEAVAQLLLAASADPNARQQEGWTPLHIAAKYGHTAVVRVLLAFSADPNARQQEGWTPLHAAAWYGHAAVVRLLLAYSADIEARNKYGCSPLHVAAYYGHREIAAALLEAGADKGARANDGETPLDVARQRNKQELIDLLT